MPTVIDKHRVSIEALCRRYGVRKMEVFGSVLRDDFDACTSDVDVLVVFDPDTQAGFDNFLDLKDALETLFERPVDLLEPHTIRNRRLRHHSEQGSVPFLWPSVILAFIWKI